MLASIEQKGMPKDSPILVRIFKEESELEVWKQDTTGHFQLLKVYPICRWSGDLGPEGQGRRPPGARGLLHDHPRADESEFQLLPRDQYRLPQRLRQSQRPPRRVPDDPWRLLLARLLRDDRRADRRNLFAGARILPRRPAIVPDPGLSVPHDAGESRAASHQSEHGLLEDDQGRQRPFRGDTSRAEGRRLRPALRVRRRTAAEILQAARLQCDQPLPGLRGGAGDRRSGAGEAAQRRSPVRATGQRQFAGRPGPHRTRRRLEQRLPGADRTHSAGAGAAARRDRGGRDSGAAAGRERLPRQPVRVETRRPGDARRRDRFGTAGAAGRRLLRPAVLIEQRRREAGGRDGDWKHHRAKARRRRPKPKSEVAKSEERKPEPQQANAAKPAAPQQQQEANAYAPAPAKNGNLLQGAQPVVPAGNFDSRFGGLQ